MIENKHHRDCILPEEAKVDYPEYLKIIIRKVMHFCCNWCGASFYDLVRAFKHKRIQIREFKIRQIRKQMLFEEELKKFQYYKPRVQVFLEKKGLEKYM